jgi:Ca2+-binding RTX toxin-like protein
MGLFTGFNVTPADVETFANASLAAFGDDDIPAGWNVVTPQALGVPSIYWDGNFFTNSGASALVLQQDSIYIVAFRGTDDPLDFAHFPGLFFGTYINLFDPLLSAVANNTPDGSTYAFTGASLGGGATNLMAEIAPFAYGGVFANAQFVAFASPNITDDSGILNIGAENDPIYKLINGYDDFNSSLDNLVVGAPQYMAGNYDGYHPLDAYAHESADIALDALTRVENSVFYDYMSPDSVVIIDASPDAVQDITPGREGTGVFYIGENNDDIIYGRAGPDYLEGFDGNDGLGGQDGNDAIAGGNGNDSLQGDAGTDFLTGDAGGDTLDGGADNDVLFGGADGDFVYGGAGNDLLFGGTSGDAFAFGPGFGTDLIVDFQQGQDYIDMTALGIDINSVGITHFGNTSLVETTQGAIVVPHTVLHASDFVF